VSPLCCVFCLGHRAYRRKRPQAPLSEPGPTFRFADGSLPTPLTFIVYGDQRLTDPANVVSADPKSRAWLANEIAAEHPAAIVLNGDVPLNGDVANDYAVFKSETKPWRDAGIKVFPSLGNHEFRGDPQKALENWWANFPELKSRRWYSAQLGSRVYMIALDTNASLTPGSDQAGWLEKADRRTARAGVFRGADDAPSAGRRYSEAYRSGP